ncbi:MAG: DUF3368 domain-containing protein [Acidobacteria bacterium]|nr:DUF3368 domain-containing protein [Acidobacteriota bacterium]
MPENSRQTLIINTGPILALIAATGSLEVLRGRYGTVRTTWEVARELEAGGGDRFGARAFREASWLQLEEHPLTLTPYLVNLLDPGEASVIQLCLQVKEAMVCIDEVVGRRVARLHNMKLTGSIGILLKARAKRFPVSIPDALRNMREKGIWLSEKVIQFALDHDPDRCER